MKPVTIEEMEKVYQIDSMNKRIEEEFLDKIVKTKVQIRHIEKMLIRLKLDPHPQAQAINHLMGQNATDRLSLDCLERALEEFKAEVRYVPDDKA